MHVLSRQVLDAGITRQLVQRLIRVFPYMCRERYPLCGSVVSTCRIANRRFEYMGRRSRASSIPPGYVLWALCLRFSDSSFDSLCALCGCRKARQSRLGFNSQLWTFS